MLSPNNSEEQSTTFYQHLHFSEGIKLTDKNFKYKNGIFKIQLIFSQRKVLFIYLCSFPQYIRIIMFFSLFLL